MFATSRKNTILRSALVLLAAGALHASAAPAINKVESRFVPSGDIQETRNLNRIGLSKFDGLQDLHGKQVFFVYWDPGATPVPKGSVLVFEYYQSRFARPQGLRINYPFEISTARKATFTIADKAFIKGGPVTRWRVRLIEEKRILAEKQSPSWKQ